jgi:hypothetical protein
VSGVGGHDGVVAPDCTFDNGHVDDVVVTGATDTLKLIERVVKEIDANPAADESVMIYSLKNAQAATCPRCGSIKTREISRFGSTPCKALWQCESCREPFDRFKCH